MPKSKKDTVIRSLTLHSLLHWEALTRYTVLAQASLQGCMAWPYVGNCQLRLMGSVGKLFHTQFFCYTLLAAKWGELCKLLRQYVCTDPRILSTALQ